MTSEREKQLLRREGARMMLDYVEMASLPGGPINSLILRDRERSVGDLLPLPAVDVAGLAEPVRHALNCAKSYCIGTHKDLVDCTCGAEKNELPYNDRPAFLLDLIERENRGAGEAGGLLNLEGLPWPCDPRANTESSRDPLAKTREIL